MTSSTNGAVTDGPRWWLRLEGLAALVIASLLYARGEHSWLQFALLFLAPDLSFAAYLAGTRIGALGYNLLHSYVGPLLLAAISLVTGRSPAIALVWIAHIGFDRLLGYGLKYPTAFADTHLGRIGRNAAS